MHHQQIITKLLLLYSTASLPAFTLSKPLEARQVSGPPTSPSTGSPTCASPDKLTAPLNATSCLHILERVIREQPFNQQYTTSPPFENITFASNILVITDRTLTSDVLVYDPNDCKLTIRPTFNNTQASNLATGPFSQGQPPPRTTLNTSSIVQTAGQIITACSNGLKAAVNSTATGQASQVSLLPGDAADAGTTPSGLTSDGKPSTFGGSAPLPMNATLSQGFAYPGQNGWTVTLSTMRLPNAFPQGNGNLPNKDPKNGVDTSRGTASQPFMNNTMIAEGP